tara:strand:- start:151 stop:339 length:189 start_codon:yes stop_codon:yes gene_type:complete
VDAWLVIALLGTIAAVGGAIWLGRHLQKGTQAKSAAEAQEKMSKVQPRNVSSTAKRLRSGKF